MGQSGINNRLKQFRTGEADFILILLAKDMEDFDDFTQRMFFDDRNVRHFKTSVVMGRSKVSLALSLDIE
ncbi:MAG: Lrp/AsnC family transcriptional regulator [Gammaproteobacteria bacterium]|nr:Lrp/AsnC family transcriptional regulator [Gammaproteobacteria bacterium]